ncbi:hypothetical protein JFK57_16960 [Escherichia coli]|nr:hypothetical protein [Escherichia coli]
MREKLKSAWLIACVAISVMAGMAYWYCYQPGDGAGMKQVMYTVLSSFGVTGCTAVILLCISSIVSIMNKTGT